ncbi:MAG: S8 family serine peptidase [Rubrivivax sp.]|nr:S8 family serine peptidase [Rubrivivax sp.]
MFKLNPIAAAAAAAAAAACALSMAAQAQFVAAPDVAPIAAPADATPAAAPLAPTQRVNVIAYIEGASLAAALTAARAPGAARKSVPWSADQQRSYVGRLMARQQAVISGAQALGATIVGQLTMASNGVLMSIDAGQLDALSRVVSVSGVMLVEDAQLALATTTVYVGANAVRARTPSVDGTGVRIAILDSGVDHTHYNLGGAGTRAAYLAAYGAATCQATPQNTSMPVWTSKVVGGFDFVGENWPNVAALQPDPNPIDCQGHGSHVADIAGGRSADGLWQGMAPGAQLFAVKVCSAVASSCSGLAILQGLDYALDPNGDGDLSDAVDVVNMSLGANFGQRENPSSAATQNVVRFGTVVSASAGNGGDVPYINGSPSSTPEAITVAQTQVTGQFAYPLITSPGGVNGNTALQTWSQPLVANISGPLKADPNITGTTAATGAGCNAYPAGFFAGSVALVRRNGCAASIKTANATNAGALAVVIDDNVAVADPPSFSFGGGGTVYSTTVVITQAAGNALRSALTAGAVNATLGFSGRISLTGSMAATSSRGPNSGYSLIKPDIGAPGASLSATVGTGNANETFGGTSGAAPVVAGAAALVLQAYPSLMPHEVKARLMGAADNNVTTNPARLPGELAPITRIGAGEVRVAGAIDNNSVMWDASNPGATSLSFGYQPATGARVLRKRVVVRNYSAVAKTYSIGTSYRYANDGASGGVTLTAPGSVSVPANSSVAFNLQMNINPAGLPVWQSTGVNGGINGNNGPLLASVEYDGYLSLTDGSETVRLPWHVLPRRSHQGTASGSVTLAGGSGAMTVSNPGGATTANVDVFSLTGTSPQLPYSSLPGPGDSFQVIDLRAAGVRGVDVGDGANSGVQFAVSRFDAVSSANMNLVVRVLIDTNGDGTDDWQLTSSRSTGNQSLSFLQKLTGCVPATNCPSTAFFFTDTDLNSSNWILTVPALPTYAGSVQTVVNPAAPFRFRVVGVDNYFTGNITDTIGSMTYQLSTPKFAAAAIGLGLPVGVSGPLGITAVPGGAAASPSQTGFLLMWRDGMPGREASVVNVN